MMPDSPVQHAVASARLAGVMLPPEHQALLAAQDAGQLDVKLVVRVAAGYGSLLDHTRAYFACRGLDWDDRDLAAAQWARILGEAGELSDEIRRGNTTGVIHETADLAIVTTITLHDLGEDPDRAKQHAWAPPHPGVLEVGIAVGQLYDGLARMTATGKDEYPRAAWIAGGRLLGTLAHLLFDRTGLTLQQAMDAKRTADTGRGPHALDTST